MRRSRLVYTAGPMPPRNTYAAWRGGSGDPASTGGLEIESDPDLHLA
jgi:hypothetical protein